MPTAAAGIDGFITKPAQPDLRHAKLQHGLRASIDAARPATPT